MSGCDFVSRPSILMSKVRGALYQLGLRVPKRYMHCLHELIFQVLFFFLLLTDDDFR